MGLSVIEGNTRIQESVTAKFAYSVEEMSERTSLSKAYLRQKIKEGKLEATHFGRRSWFSARTVKHF